MPEEGHKPERIAALAPSRSTALSLRRETALSTLLFPAEPDAAQEEDSFSFRDLWRVVIKRKWSIIGFFLIVVVAAAIGTLMQTPIYRTEITLKIESDASKIIPFNNGL